MTTVKKSKEKNLLKFSRPLVASALVTSGLVNLAMPVLAAGTAAGTSISNTAEASYEDPTDPTKPLNTYSNTVVVKVSEVAGIAVISAGVEDTTPATPVVGGNELNYNFDVKNIGNDPTKFVIPGTAFVTGPGAVQKVQYFDTATNAWVDIAPATPYISGSFAPDEVLKVRVVVKVDGNATSGQDIKVSLGNTPTEGDQNISYVPGGPTTAGDIYTVDNANGGATNEVDGAPINGQREASAFNSIKVGQAAKDPLAFATVLKTSAYDNKGTSATLSDDEINYNLSLKVAQTSPDPDKEAADLGTTQIKLDSGSGSTPTQKILVSDALPAEVEVVSVTAPTGWTAVYSTTPISQPTDTALTADWKILGTQTITNNKVGTETAEITRIGFIKDGSNATVARGTTVSGMTIKVKLKASFTGGTIANIAQVFGNTSVNGAADATKPVYDESGDQEPNNYNGSNPPATNTPTDGKANPADPDSSGQNTGTTEAGESNLVNIVPPDQLGILNGPANAPAAVGPGNDNNLDFTNKSARVAKLTVDPNNGQPTGTVTDPESIAFTNTVRNTGTAVADITLLPSTTGITAPSGTVVTISYQATEVTYKYNGTIWESGTVNSSGVFTSNATLAPIKLPNVPVNGDVTYGVKVDLPISTALTKGYAVPIVAFQDNNNDKVVDTNEPQNITIDRVYTGYLQLVKYAKIVDKNGVTVEDWTTSPTKTAAPGEKILYKVEYKNISEDATTGSGSVELNAQNITIVEDGLKGNNNWGTTTNHSPNGIPASMIGNTTFAGGATNQDNDQTITKYTYKVTSIVAPQTSGTFEFTRVVK